MRFTVDHSRDDNKFAVVCPSCDGREVSPRFDTLPDHTAIHFANAHAAEAHYMVTPGSGHFSQSEVPGQRVLTLVGAEFQAPSADPAVDDEMTDLEADEEDDEDDDDPPVARNNTGRKRRGRNATA